MSVAAGLAGLDRRGWTSVAGMGGFVALLHIVGWGSLLILVAPHNYQLGDAGVAGIVRVFRRMRSGEFDEAELERRLDERGFANRLLRPLTKAVRKPWQMYPLGFLFGLGFDTATEISLLVLAGGAAALTLPWYAVL